MSDDIRARLRDYEDGAPTGTIDVTLVDERATRYRRRRVGGATAVVGATAAVAVVLASGLAGRPIADPAHPAAPTDSIGAVTRPACGEQIPGPASDDVLGLGVFTDVSSGDVGADVSVQHTSDTAIDLSSGEVRTYLVDADATVVAEGAQDPGTTELQPGAGLLVSASMPAVACSGDGGALADGSYRLYASVRGEVAGRQIAAFTGGTSVEIVGGRQVEACGAPVPEATTDPRAQEIALGLSGGVSEPGSTTAVAKVDTTWQDATAPVVVQTRLAYTDADGDVVGWSDSTIGTVAEQTPIRAEIDLTGTACDGALLAPGDYGVVAVVTWYQTGSAPTGASVGTLDLGRHAVAASRGCGEIVLGQGEAVPDEAWACLDGARETGAVLRVTALTTEGDPVLTVYRVGPYVDGLEITTDWTQDRFAGDQTVTVETCPDTVTAAQPEGCRPQ